MTEYQTTPVLSLYKDSMTFKMADRISHPNLETDLHLSALTNNKWHKGNWNNSTNIAALNSFDVLFL